MAVTNIFNDIDLKKNSILNFKVNPLTTIERTSIGNTLGLSDKGFIVFDTDVAANYVWDGAQWTSASSAYTNEDAQDTIGSILSSEFTYNDSTPSISINAINWNKIVGAPDSKLANVIDYGADETGAEDSTSAFEDAIASGLTVYVPTGTYLITSGLTLNDSQTIYGEHKQSILYTTSGTINIITTGDYSTVCNLTFLGTGEGTLPGGVLTSQNGVRVAENSASVINCTFRSFDGAGLYLFPTSGSKLYNRIINCYAEDCTIGFFDLLNSEYVTFDSCFAFSCVLGYWDRAAGNNRYVNCSGLFSTDGFRLTAGGNGDHGACIGCTFNHNINNINVQSCTNGWIFTGCNSWSGNILLGSTGTANKVIISESAIAIGTITPTTTTNCVLRDNYFTTVTENAASGTLYINNTGSSTNNYYSTVAGSITSAQLRSSLTDEVGTGSLVFGTSPTFTTSITTPSILGGTTASDGITYQSTTATGTPTGMAHKWLGGINGGVTIMQMNNDGTNSIGTVAPLANVRLFITGATNGASAYSLFVRNSNGENLFFIENNGNINYGNATNSTSTHSFNGIATFGTTNNALTNTISYPAVFQSITSGTATTGSGVGIQFNAENASGTSKNVASFTFPYTDATNTSEDTDFAVNLIRGGSLVESFRITAANSPGKIILPTGTNASIGVSSAMTAGTITVSTTAVTASSKIFLTYNTIGGTPGFLSAPTASIVAGTSFVINSSSGTDTSTVNWWIIN